MKRILLKRTPLKRKPAKKTKARKPKAIPLTKLKKKLDEIFSKYIRAKYKKQCYTCDQKYPTLHCGHFVSRQYLVTRWDEDNCRPQCYTCNIRKHGNVLEFEERLITELGDDRVRELKSSRKRLLQPDRAWYEKHITIFSEKLSTYG